MIVLFISFYFRGSYLTFKGLLLLLLLLLEKNAHKLLIWFFLFQFKTLQQTIEQNSMTERFSVMPFLC